MRVIVFGASGMVGQGVVRECLRDPQIERVLTIVRSPSGTSDPKIQELVHKDFTDFSAVESQLQGYDACFFCLGVSAAGMSEADYRRVTYDYALAAGTTLARINPGMTFIYVSGEGTDSSGKGAMWARVKGETENALLKLPFKSAYMFRPGLIKPGKGITSRTKIYRVIYALGAPLFPIVQAVAPNLMTTTEKVGRAMINAARNGAPRQVLHTADLNALAAS